MSDRPFDVLEEERNLASVEARETRIEREDYLFELNRYAAPLGELVERED